MCSERFSQFKEAMRVFDNFLKHGDNHYLILKINTLRMGAVKFEIPQKYEERVIDCLASEKSTPDR